MRGMNERKDEEEEGIVGKLRDCKVVGVDKANTQSNNNKNNSSNS